MGFKDDLLKISKEYQVKILDNHNIAKYLDNKLVNIQRLINYHKIPVLKKGLYLLDTNTNNYEIAFELDKFSYISLDTALYIYGLIPEIVLPIYSITTKTPGEFSNIIGVFVYRHIKEDIFFGYKFNDDFSYRIAEKEKALADYFYFSKLRITKNIITSVENNNFNSKSVKDIIEWFQEERFQKLETIDFKKLFKYGKKINQKVFCLTKLLNYYFESEYYENYK